MSAPRLKSVEFRREREGAWRDLARLVETAERRGLGALSAAELARLPGLYRLATSSLSVARSISLDRNVVEHLDALCVRAYGCLYASRRGFFAALTDLLTVRIPAVVRARAGLVLGALLLIGLGVAVGWALVDADPERFYAFVPAGLAGDRGPHATTQALRDVVYHRVEAADELAAFAVFLFTHNTTVGVLSFAVGVLAGFPTALLLFYNGLLVGALSSVYASRGLGLDLWAWLLPHGVPELTAIACCGAAGFLLARGLLFPGTRPRVESLAASGREAAVLVLGAAVLLMVAGFVEGVLRQVVTDPTIRLVIATLLLVAMLAWFSVGRRRTAS